MKRIVINIDKSAFVIEKKEIERMLKWASYVPSKYNLEELLNKKGRDINLNELNILKRYKEDLRISEILNRYFINREKCTKVEKIEIFDLCDNFNLQEIANHKLSEQELNEINKLIIKDRNANIKDLNESLNLLSEKPISKRTMVEDYFCYMLETRIKANAIHQLEENIIKNIPRRGILPNDAKTLILK
jgi:hypothetical protein